MDGLQICQNVVLPFAAAGFGGWIAAQFALGRFQKEKAWERKTAAYTVMFEALHDMGAWFDRHWNAEAMRTEIPAEESNRLGQEYRKARDTLSRRIAMEDWLLPEVCTARIRAMEAVLNEDYETFFDEIERGYAAVFSAAYDLRQIVRSDLGLESRIRSRVRREITKFKRERRRRKLNASPSSQKSQARNQ